MNLTAVNASHWQISTHLNGEVLTARVNADDVDVFVLGVPAGFTVAEVEGWLRDLLGVARETSRHDTGERPIPILLHHVLTGLLFSHAELWDRAGGTLACSCVFVRAGNEVAFGWVGERDPVVQIRGETLDVGWVRVRDDEGREARAFAIDAQHPLTVSLLWPSELDAEAEGRSAELNGRWVVMGEGAPADDVAVSAATHPDPAAQAAALAAFENAPPRLDAVAAAPAGPPALEPVSVPPPASWAPPGYFDPGSSEAPGLAFDTPAVPAAPAHEIGIPQLPVAPMAPAASAPIDAHVAPEESVTIHEALPESVSPPPAFEDAPPARPEPVVNVGWSDVYESDAAHTEIETRPSGGVLGWLRGLLPGARRSQPAVPDFPAPSQAALARPSESTHAPPARTSPSTVARAVAANAARTVPTPDPAPPMVVESEPAPAPQRPAAVAHEIDLGSAPVAATPIPVTLVPEPPPVAHVAPVAPVTPQTAQVMPVLPPPVAAMPESSDDPFELSPPRRIAPRRPPQRPTWPEPSDERAETPIWKKPWAWAALVVALFLGGWLVGSLQHDRPAGGPNLVTRALRGVGLGGSRYEVTINSRPPGAWIAVGGKDLARRTPATIDLAPGEHHVTLSFSDLGSAGYTVRGERGDRVTLDAALWGSIAIRGGDAGLPVSVSVDGTNLGFAPVQLDSVLPGPHDIRFSGPGMPSWSQTVTVRVSETSDVLARPMTSPATGMIEVRALAAGEGSEPISGATVFVDGVRRGSTPLTLELPRGPHSVRVELQGEQAPIQVIDLPGGNQRFATFEFGLDLERPNLVALAPPAKIAIDRPATISAALLGVGATEVREMWLHVRTPDDTWRRYQMVMMKATGGVVGVAVYPPTMFDGSGRTRWYVSANTQQGDEYFTEILGAEMQAPSGPIRR